MLAGYASRKDLSQGVHDPISVRVVAFEQGGKKLVLVSTDIVGFYGGTAASMRKAILGACGLQPSELFLAAIHTHSRSDRHARPREGPPEQRRVHQDAGNAVGRRRARGAGPHGPRADRRRERFFSRGRKPARAREGRRWEDPGAAWPQSLGADGPRSAGAPRFPRGERRARQPWSSPMPPTAPRWARETTSSAATSTAWRCSSWKSTSKAESLPRPLPAHPATSTPGSACCPSSTRRRAGFPSRSCWARCWARRSSTCWRASKKPCPAGPIKTAFKTLALPRKQRGTIDAATGGESPEFNVTVGRVGDVAVVGLGGEAFNEIGKAIKTASPFPHTLIITHCNGAAGYLPTKEAYP